MKYHLHGGPRDGLVMDVGEEIAAPLVLTFEYATGKETDPEIPEKELVNVLVARYKLSQSNEDHADYRLSFSEQRSYELPWIP